MRTIRIVGPVLLCAAWTWQACSDATDDGAVTTSNELAGALAGAAAGDVVHLADATFRGSFRVPAGVTVEGRDGTVVVAEGGAGFILEASGAASALRGLTIQTERGGDQGHAAVIVTGQGEVALESLRIELAAGMGVVAEQSGRLVLSDVAIAGDLDDERLAELATPVRANEVAVAGLVISGRGALLIELTDVDMRDVAGYGAVLVDLDGTWQAGRLRGIAGTGILIEASRLTLTDVAVHAGRRSPFVGTFSLGFGVVISRGSEVATTDLQVVDVQGFGLLQDDASSTHDRPRLVRNAGPGAWVQSSSALTDAFALRRGVVRGNGGVGVQLFDVADAVIEDSIIWDTRARPDFNIVDEPRTVADGLQAANDRIPAALRVDGSALFSNGRVGVLAGGFDLALEGGAAPVSLCGNTQVGDEWGCEDDAGGTLVCLRSAGPAVGPGWRCADGLDGTACTSTDPALLDAEPDLVPRGGDGLPAEADCRDRVSALVESLGLVGGIGLSEDLATGLDGGAVLDVTREWECSTTGGERRCLDGHVGENVRLDDRDNPALDEGPGWECEDTATGRRCFYAANGLLTRDGASNTIDDPVVEPLVARRDAEVIAADLQNTAQFQLNTAIPVACEDTTPCAGFLSRGVTAGATLIGEGGIVDASGRVAGSITGEGLARPADAGAP